jgi:hypothetical protein
VNFIERFAASSNPADTTLSCRPSFKRKGGLAWSIGMTIGPVVALVFLRDDPGSTSFVLTAIGLGIVVAGVLIVSNVWKTPTYNMILAWNPEAMPADWEAGRRRYFTINWIQFGSDLGGVRPISGGSGLPLGELYSVSASWRYRDAPLLTLPNGAVIL